jgi:hypothetical protein
LEKKKMTDKKVTPLTLEYLLLKGALTELPQEDQVRVNATVELLMEVLRDAGPLGILALSLVGARILSTAELESAKGDGK